MSTISLPPIKQKIRITRELSCVVKSSLGDSTSLKQAGILIGSNGLLIDPGTIVRIEGFTARVSGGNWPDVKLSIYPEGLKMGQCYIELTHLDGISWDLIKDPPKAPPVPIRRVSVLTSNDYGWSKTTPKKYEQREKVWGETFGRDGYHIKDKKSVVLNPQSLSPTEIAESKFKISYNCDIFEISVKIDKTHYSYTAFLYENAYFNIHLKPGFMEGQLSEIKYKIVIYEGGRYGDNSKKKSIWSKGFTQEEFDKLDHDKMKQMISDEIKKLHTIE